MSPTATTIIVAAAQSISLAGGIAANAARHAGFIDAAARRGVSLLVFPELSLTGYDLELAHKLAIRPDSELLAPLHRQAREAGMTVIVGVPLLQDGGERPYIGAAILGKSERPDVYLKQYLYGAENDLFHAGPGGKIITVNGTNIGLAICADVSRPEHPAAALQAGAQVYAAGVLVTTKAYDAKDAMLRGYSLQHGMPVLMANHGAPTGGWAAAGRSAFWADGELVVAAPDEGEYLVMAQRQASGWTGTCVALD